MQQANTREVKAVERAHVAIDTFCESLIKRVNALRDEVRKELDQIASDQQALRDKQMKVLEECEGNLRRGDVFAQNRLQRAMTLEPIKQNNMFINIFNDVTEVSHVDLLFVLRVGLFLPVCRCFRLFLPNTGENIPQI
jgi:hypothetical protein